MTTYRKMELKELKRLVREGEGSQLEFKLKSTHPDKIMREIAAFANTKGGKLLLGVSDDGGLSGLKFPDEDRFVMARGFVRYVSPLVNYSETEVVLENGRAVLVYDILPSEENLVFFNATGEEGGNKLYVRNADRSIQASKEVKEILKQRLKGKSYRFQYGDKEDKLMKYLDQNPSVTVQDFAKLSGIDTKLSSKTLVLLVLAGVLDVSPHENGDQFFLRITE